MATPTPKLHGLLGAFDSFTAGVEKTAGELHEKMERVRGRTVDSIHKFGKAVDEVEARAQQIDDAANQLTNGGPPLEPSTMLPEAHG